MTIGNVNMQRRNANREREWGERITFLKVGVLHKQNGEQRKKIGLLNVGWIILRDARSNAGGKAKQTTR